MPEKMDEIFAKSQISPQKDANRHLPNYESNFGNEVEELIANTLYQKGRIVEDFELGSKGSGVDDKIGKVDIWIKFECMDDPLGIQFTMSNNEKEIEKKIQTLKENKWMAKKEARDDSVIKWSGNANVVLVRSDKIKIANYWKKSKEKGVNFSEVIDDPFVGEIFNQIFKQLGEINPIKRDILRKAFEGAHRRGKKSKK